MLLLKIKKVNSPVWIIAVDFPHMEGIWDISLFFPLPVVSLFSLWHIILC